jgi:hypothetical protein
LQASPRKLAATLWWRSGDWLAEVGSWLRDFIVEECDDPIAREAEDVGDIDRELERNVLARLPMRA